MLTITILLYVPQVSQRWEVIFCRSLNLYPHLKNRCAALAYHAPWLVRVPMLSNQHENLQNYHLSSVLLISL